MYIEHFEGAKYPEVINNNNQVVVQFQKSDVDILKDVCVTPYVTMSCNEGIECLIYAVVLEC